LWILLPGFADVQFAPGIQGVIHLKLDCRVLLVVREAQTKPGGNGFQTSSIRVSTSAAWMIFASRSSAESLSSNFLMMDSKEQRPST